MAALSGTLMADDLDDFDDKEFTPVERKRLRQLLEDDKRTRWFWSTARTWVIWIGGVAVAITATYTWLKDVVKFLASAPK